MTAGPERQSFPIRASLVDCIHYVEEEAGNADDKQRHGRCCVYVHATGTCCSVIGHLLHTLRCWRYVRCTACVRLETALIARC